MFSDVERSAGARRGNVLGIGATYRSGIRSVTYHSAGSWLWSEHGSCGRKHDD
jgi:hypothetical protein